MSLNMMHEAGGNVPINRYGNGIQSHHMTWFKLSISWGKNVEVKLIVCGLGQSGSQSIPEGRNSSAVVVVGDRLCHCWSWLESQGL